MTELKKDVGIAISKFAAEEKSAAKGWWSTHKIAVIVGVVCTMLGFIAAKLV